MEVTLIGPGAVGTLLGGLLRLGGHEVTLRGRRAAASAADAASAASADDVRIILPTLWLRADGIRFRGPENPVDPADAVLVTLGRQHLHSIRRPDFTRLVPKDASLLFVNCDASEPERLLPPRQRPCLCLTLMDSVKLQDRESELLTEKPALIVESSFGLPEVFQGLSRFGFQIRFVDDAVPYIDSFFLHQLLFLPVAMCNTTLSHFLSYPEGRELARVVLEEGFAAMERAGRPLARLPLMDPRDLAIRLERKPGSFDRDREKPGRCYNSVLQSFLKGRPAEVGRLNGKAVEIASGAGLHLTWNWRLMQKAARVSRVGFYRDPAELLESLV